MDFRAYIISLEFFWNCAAKAGEGTCQSWAPLTAEFLCRPEDDDFDMEEELRKLHPQKPQRQRELEPRSRRGMVVDPRVSVIHEGDGGPGDGEESDSDGPILYRDDEEDDEDLPTGELLLFFRSLLIFLQLQG